MLHSHLTDFAYVQRLSMEPELETRDRQDTGLSGGEWMDRIEPQLDAGTAGGTYPLLNALFTQDTCELGLDRLSEFGLQRTLDGIAVMIAETSA
ncbi:hypothetical protein [Streptomyces sp. NPDC088400]|uniref:hypothetical protein n=1 Tax=Streptomyces sp. NPDC088400 TaxID=3365861 RepID=UPI003815AAC3